MPKTTATKARAKPLRELLNHYLTEAKRGDIEAARDLLLLYCEAVQEGWADWRLNLYVYRAFGRILAGENPTRALYLTRQRGRPTGEKAERNLRIAIEVEGMKRAGATLETAAFEIANRFGLHERKIQEIYTKKRRAARAQLAMNAIDREC
jgi:hypothetical protein